MPSAEATEAGVLYRVLEMAYVGMEGDRESLEQAAYAPVNVTKIGNLEASLESWAKAIRASAASGVQTRDPGTLRNALAKALKVVPNNTPFYFDTWDLGKEMKIDNLGANDLPVFQEYLDNVIAILQFRHPEASRGTGQRDVPPSAYATQGMDPKCRCPEYDEAIKGEGVGCCKGKKCAKYHTHTPNHCFRCGSKGHWADSCPTAVGDGWVKGGGPPKAKAAVAAHRSTSSLPAPQDDGDFQGWYALDSMASHVFRPAEAGDGETVPIDVQLAEDGATGKGGLHPNGEITMNGVPLLPLTYLVYVAGWTCQWKARRAPVLRKGGHVVRAVVVGDNWSPMVSPADAVILRQSIAEHMITNAPHCHKSAGASRATASRPSIRIMGEVRPMFDDKFLGDNEFRAAVAEKVDKGEFSCLELRDMWDQSVGGQEFLFVLDQEQEEGEAGVTTVEHLADDACPATPSATPCVHFDPNSPWVTEFTPSAKPATTRQIRGKRAFVEAGGEK